MLEKNCIPLLNMLVTIFPGLQSVLDFLEILFFSKKLSILVRRTREDVKCFDFRKICEIFIYCKYMSRIKKLQQYFYPSTCCFNKIHKKIKKKYELNQCDI
jgi:hypothetical protein